MCPRATSRARPLRMLALLALGLLIVIGVIVTLQTTAAWAGPTTTPATPAPAAVTTLDPALPGVASSTPRSDTTPSAAAAGPGAQPAAPSPGDEDPGLFDIAGQIRKAINDVIGWIATTGLTPVLDALGRTVLATPDLTGNDQVMAIWTTSLVTANAIFVLFVIAGGFIIAARESLQTSYGLKEIAPRVVVAGVAANVSLIVCRKAIEVTNALTGAIAGQGVDGNSAATALREMLNQPVRGDMPPILFSLLILAALVMAIVVVITFILRTAALVMLIGVAPLALTCHATPQTEGLAYTWWRALAACLGIQLGQAVIILATVRVFLTPAGSEVLGLPVTTSGLLGILVCLTMLWLLIKLPGWMRHLVLGPLARRHGRGLIGQVIRAVVMLKTLGALAGIGRAAPRPARSVQRPRTATVPAGPTHGTLALGAGGPRPSRPPHTPRPARSMHRRPRVLAGPAAFSDAATSHTPLTTSAGTATAPTFSSALPPGVPRTTPAGGGPVRFSHRPAAASAIRAPTAGAAPVRFSDTPTTPALRPSASVLAPPPTPTFSAVPRPQTAPKRPPAPITPRFSASPESRELIRSPQAAPNRGTAVPGVPGRSRLGDLRSRPSHPQERG